LSVKQQEFDIEELKFLFLWHLYLVVDLLSENVGEKCLCH